MQSFLDICRFRAVSAGTGSFVVSSAVQGYQTPASAGAVDGDTYRYRAENFDLSEWEVGYGTYSVATLTLARSTVLYNSSGTTSAINFTTRPQVAVVALARDIPKTIDLEVTSGIAVNVDNDASVVRVNLAVSGTMTINMPLSTNKVCDTLVADWKGEAGTYNITVNPSGAEKIQGRSSWVIASDYGSIYLRRIPGVGYAI